MKTTLRWVGIIAASLFLGNVAWADDKSVDELLKDADAAMQQADALMKAITPESSAAVETAAGKIKEAREAHARGDYEAEKRAANEGLEAIATVDEVLVWDQRADLLLRRASAIGDAGDRIAARPDLEESLALRQRHKGVRTESGAMTLLRLGQAAGYAGEKQQSVEFYRQSVDIYKELVPADNRDRIRALVFRAAAEVHAENDAAVCRAALDEALAATDLNPVANPDLLFEALRSNSVAERRVQHLEAAESSAKRALAIADEQKLDDLDRASVRVTLALVLAAQNRQAEALPLMEEVVAMRRQRLGENDPKTLEAIERVKAYTTAVAAAGQKSAPRPVPTREPAAPTPAPSTPAPTPEEAPAGPIITPVPLNDTGTEVAAALARFEGFRMDDLCNARIWSMSLAPWAANPGEPPVVDKPAPAPVPETDYTPAQCRAVVGEARVYLDALYGDLPAPARRGLDALWAPFMTYPGPAVHSYFKKANPLLAALMEKDVEIEGLRVAMSEATADALRARLYGDKSGLVGLLDGMQNIARQLHDCQEEATAIQKSLAALGDPPNPLAEACNARARHHALAESVLAPMHIEPPTVSLRVSEGALLRARLREGFAADEIRVEAEDVDPQTLEVGKPIELHFPDAGRRIVSVTAMRDGQPVAKATATVEVTDNDSLAEMIKQCTTLKGNIDVQGTYHMARKPLDGRSQPKDWNAELQFGKYFVPDAPIKWDGDFFTAEADDPSSGDKFVVRGQLSGDGHALLNVELTCESEDKTPSGLKQKLHFVASEVPIRYLYMMKEAHFGGEGLSMTSRFSELSLEMHLSDTDFEGQFEEHRTFIDRAFAETGTRLDIQFKGQASSRDCWTQVDPNGKIFDAPPPLTNRRNVTVGSAGGTTPGPTPGGPNAPPDDGEARAEAVKAQRQTIAFLERNVAAYREAQSRARGEAERRQASISLEQAATELVLANAELTRLETGVMTSVRTPWQERQERETIPRALERVTLFANLHRNEVGLMRLAANVDQAVGGNEDMRDWVRRQLANGAEGPERLTRLYKVRDVLAQKLDANRLEAESVELHASARVALAEDTKKTAEVSLMIGTFFIPGAGHAMMLYSAGSGYAEGGTLKAVENVGRALSNKVDIACAAIEGWNAVGPDGKPLGWSGALQSAAETWFTNKVMDKVMAHAPANWAQQVDVDLPSMSNRREPIQFEQFKSPEQRLKEDLFDIAVIERSNPGAREKIEARHATVVKRVELKQKLAEATALHESRLAEQRRPDGSIDTTTDAYKKVKGEWEADMKKLREDPRYADGPERMGRHNDAATAVNDQFGKDAIVLSGSEPKSCLSDIDVTANSIEAGQAYVKALERPGISNVQEFPDRWVVTDLDMTVWKPSVTGHEKVGSSMAMAGTTMDALPGSDKFGTLGGLYYTSNGAKGVKDPRGAVIANAKKAAEAGIGGKGEPDLHVIGKSVGKAADAAGHDLDPTFAQKATNVRNHATAEEAGISTFGASPEVKARERDSFVRQARGELTTSYGKATNQSAELNGQRMKEIGDARAAGDSTKERELREVLIRSRDSNEATLDGISQMDPKLVGQLRAAGVDGPTVAPPPPATNKTGVEGFGWLLNTQVPAPAATAPDAIADPAQRALATKATEAVRTIDVIQKTAKMDADQAAQLASLRRVLDLATRDPAAAREEAHVLTGYELEKLLSDVTSGGSPPAKK